MSEYKYDISFFLSGDSNAALVQHVPEFAEIMQKL